MTVCIGCIYYSLCFSKWLKEEIGEETCLLGNDEDFRDNEFS